jgi:hypothetical protein
MVLFISGVIVNISVIMLVVIGVEKMMVIFVLITGCVKVLGDAI